MSEIPSASSVQQQLDAALGDYEKQMRALNEFRDNAASASTVVHSKDRMLTMTFTGHGELQKVTVNSNGYRSMAPNELATAISETVAAGRTQALEKMAGMFDGQALPGVSMGDLVSGRADPGSVLEAVLGSMLEVLPPGALSESERTRLWPGV
jgi:DNA-binding protein YbaB